MGGRLARRSEVDPGASLDVVDLGLARHSVVIKMWAEGQPVPPPDEPPAPGADQAALLGVLERYLDQAPVAELRGAWAGKAPVGAVG